MLDTSRYRPILLVLGAVLAIFVMLDLGLRLSLGISPPALLRASFHNEENRAAVAGRVSGVIADRARETGRQASRPLAVIVGSSSALTGLRTATLNAVDRDHRWLNLARTGSSFDELEYSFGPMFDSGVDAELVVVAIHVGWFAGRVVGDPVLDEIMISSSAPRTSWLMFNRGRLNHLVRLELELLRERVLPGLGVDFDVIYPPRADPWTEPHLGGQLRASDTGQLELWRRKRWLDASWYEHVDVDLAAAVIAGCQRIGKRVIVVLMPEATALRTAIPATADAALARALARLPSPPPVLDLRAAVPDELFGDYIHLGEAGAQRLAELLIPRLR